MTGRPPMESGIPNEGVTCTLDSFRNIESHPLYKTVLKEYRRLRDKHKQPLVLTAECIAIMYNIPSYTVLCIIDDNYGLLS